MVNKTFNLVAEVISVMLLNQAMVLQSVECTRQTPLVLEALLLLLFLTHQDTARIMIKDSVDNPVDIKN